MNVGVESYISSETVINQGGAAVHVCFKGYQIREFTRIAKPRYRYLTDHSIKLYF